MARTRKFIILLLPVVFALAAFADTSPERLLSQGRADEAIAALQKTTRAAPDDAEAYNLLCRAYFSFGDWDRAISAGQKAVELAPNNGLYHLWLGRAYGEKADSASFLSAAGLAGKVRTEFETAVRLSPGSAEARSDLAEFYLEAPGIVGGGRDKAESQADTLEKLDPAKAHWVRGRIAEKKKDRATAEREYRGAIEASHGGALAWFNLALFYRHNSQFDQMEDALNHAISAPLDRPEVVMESAEVLIRSGRNLGNAIELLHRYLASNDKVEQAPAFKAHFLLGTALEKQGDKQGAAREYSAALALAKNYSRAQEALARLNH